MSLGVTEIILILVVVLLLFGGKRLPELARGLGRAEAEYKKAKESLQNEFKELKSESGKKVLEKSKAQRTVRKTKQTSTKKAVAAKKKPQTKKAVTKKVSKK